MASPKTHRKLTAILSADVVGYSRPMGDDEEATIETLTAYRKVFTADPGCWVASQNDLGDPQILRDQYTKWYNNWGQFRFSLSGKPGI